MPDLYRASIEAPSKSRSVAFEDGVRLAAVAAGADRVFTLCVIPAHDDEGFKLNLSRSLVAA